MKKALFLLLDDFADWEGSHLSSILNQNEKWSVKTISLKEKIILEIENMGFKSVREFAIKNNIPLTTVSALFKGVSPNLKTLYVIANALDLYVHELLQDVDLDHMYGGLTRHGC